MEIWKKLCHPPETALKKITGGRLGGMTDIKPQWRYLVMTDVFGPCGIGWKYVVKKRWTEPGSEDQVVAFVDIDLFVKDGTDWSDPIPGNGGSMLVAKETKKLYTSDEAFKMATTDALSTAMKLLGVGADIYMGHFDGAKYTGGYDFVEEFITVDQQTEINDLIKEVKADKIKFLDFFKVTNLGSLPVGKHSEAVTLLKAKRG